MRPVSPDVLVEAATEDPRAVGQRPRVGRDRRERIVERLRLSKVKLRQLQRPPDEVHVRVHPARHHQASAQIDELGVGRVTPQVLGAPQRDHPAVAREQRVRGAARADVNATAVKQK